jgi:hypothetical protein
VVERASSPEPRIESLAVCGTLNGREKWLDCRIPLAIAELDREGSQSRNQNVKDGRVAGVSDHAEEWLDRVFGLRIVELNREGSQPCAAGREVSKASGALDDG